MNFIVCWYGFHEDNVMTAVEAVDIDDAVSEAKNLLINEAFIEIIVKNDDKRRAFVKSSCFHGFEVGERSLYFDGDLCKNKQNSNKVLKLVKEKE